MKLRRHDNVGVTCGRTGNTTYGRVKKVLGDKVIVQWFLTGTVVTVGSSDVRYVGRSVRFGQ